MLTFEKLALSVSTMQGDPTPLLSADATLEANSLHVLTGPSGCGKTQLLKALLAVEGPDLNVQGKILFDGIDLRTLSTEEIVRQGVGYVAQNPAENFHQPTVFDEIVSSRLYLGIPWPEALEATHGLAARVGLAPLLDRSPSELSGGELQRAAIAAALSQSLAQDHRLMLLDEPFSFLDTRGRRAILDLLAEILPQTTILVVTHHPDEFAPLQPVRWEVRNRELTRREAGRRPAADMAVATPAAAPGQPPLLRAEDLSFAAGPRRVHVADFSLRPGELVSLTGANGSGKSTLCRVLCGLVPYRGRISLDQRELASFDRRALSSRVALVAQIPHQNLLCDTVRHELELLPELIGAAVDPGRLSDVARTCGVDSLAGRYVETLSGGEARRVALAACAIVGKAPLWLLDEPEFGLDRAGERFLCEMVERHCRAGGAVLNVSHGNVLSALSCKEYGILSNGEVALGNAAH